MPPALADPTPTADRRLAPLMGADWAGGAATATENRKAEKVVTIPGIDLDAFNAKWSDERRALAPQLKRAHFRVPIWATWAQYRRERESALKAWFDSMRKQGWGVHADAAHQIRVYPGVYPAHDLRDGIPLLDQREFVIEAYFRKERPRLIKFDVPPELLEPLVIRR